MNKIENEKKRDHHIIICSVRVIQNTDICFPFPFIPAEVSIFSRSCIGQSLGQMAWFVASWFYLFFSPHISCALWNTVGAGIRLSVLPVLPLTCLGNCFTGGCQIKKYPIWERQRQPVNICPPCLFCPLMWSSCLSVCLSILSRVGTLSATERLEVQQIFMVLFSLSMILWAFKF